MGSDNDDNSSDEALSVDKTRPASLDKMIALVANLVERSRGQDFRLRLSTKDYNAIAGGKVKTVLKYEFLYFVNCQMVVKNLNILSLIPRSVYNSSKKKTVIKND